MNLKKALECEFPSEFKVELNRIMTPMGPENYDVAILFEIEYPDSTSNIIKSIFAKLENSPYFKNKEQRFQAMINDRRQLKKNIEVLQKYKDFYDLYKGLKES